MAHVLWFCCQWLMRKWRIFQTKQSRDLTKTIEHSESKIQIFLVVALLLLSGGRVLLITFVDSAYMIVMKWECSQVQCLLILIICNCTILCYFLFSLGQRKWLPHEHSILATTLYIIFHEKNYKTPCKQNRQNMENASHNPHPLAAWWAVSTKIYG